MKLIIQTQYRENYGAHDWDGEGECPQYWKFKGGSTYVYPAVQFEGIDALNELVDSIIKHIEHSDDYSEVYVIDWELADDDAVECEEWEAPILIDEVKPNMVVCNRFQTREQGGYSEEVIRKLEYFNMAYGRQKDFDCRLELIDGNTYRYGIACDVIRYMRENK